jgi:hypothetical protein
MVSAPMAPPATSREVTVLAAPRERTYSACSEREMIPINCAPSAFATATAAEPTPPAAPVTAIRRSLRLPSLRSPWPSRSPVPTLPYRLDRRLQEEAPLRLRQRQYTPHTHPAVGRELPSVPDHCHHAVADADLSHARTSLHHLTNSLQPVAGSDLEIGMIHSRCDRAYSNLTRLDSCEGCFFDPEHVRSSILTHHDRVATIWGLRFGFRVFRFRSSAGWPRPMVVANASGF